MEHVAAGDTQGLQRGGVHPLPQVGHHTGGLDPARPVAQGLVELFLARNAAALKLIMKQ
jgi:hypothetical protein